MNVLFLVRSDFFSTKGGVYVQINNTVNELNKLGINCNIGTSIPDSVTQDYDIVHLTDLTWIYDNLKYINILKKKFCGKIILSSIYWSFDDYAQHGSPILQRIFYNIFGINGFERIKSLGKLILKFNRMYFIGVYKNYVNSQRYIAQNVDWVLPNANLEMDHLNKRLNLKLTNYSIVYNAIDLDFFDDIIKSNPDIHRRNNYIACVGRIDARKNQLNLLQALMNTSYNILFIGNYGPNSFSYYNKLVSLAKKRGNVQFLGHLPHSDIFKILLSCKAHVLTSWLETPGLVNLEAGYAGCNLVLTNKGSVSEYFDANVHYCEPNNHQTILDAVNAAMSTSNNLVLREHIKNKYSWQISAQQTLSAYNKVLDLC